MNLEYEVEDGQPVTCMSWNDAQAYAGWLSRETGEAYRLPSESEWEYAARSGATTRYHFGNDAARLCEYGNVADRTELPNGGSWNDAAPCDDGAVYPTSVGRYRENDFGLHDMHGNVWEWVGGLLERKLRGRAFRRQCVAEWGLRAARVAWRFLARQLREEPALRGPHRGTPPGAGTTSTGSVWSGRSRLESLPPYLIWGVPRGANAPLGRGNAMAD